MKLATSPERPLLLDKRVGSVDLMSLLRRQGLPVRLAMLRSADVAFDGDGPSGPVRIGIELKNVNDLIQSFVNKRLIGGQIPKMVRQYKICYLVVQGLIRLGDDGLILTWRPSHKEWVPTRTRMTYAALSRLLCTLEEKAGFRVRRTTARAETAQVVSDIYRWWGKPWSAHKAHLAYDESFRNPPDLNMFSADRAPLCERWAKELTGVGWVLAKRVSAHYDHDARDMVSAGPKSWLKIEGIGPKLCASIMKEIHGSEDP
jgi:ERCC4-type nuclease